MLSRLSLCLGLQRQRVVQIFCLFADEGRSRAVETLLSAPHPNHALLFATYCFMPPRYFVQVDEAPGVS
jgi:hypothetical protein